MVNKVSVVLGCVLLIPAVARADAPGATAPTATTSDHHRHRVGGTFGLGTPIGALGVQYTSLPSPAIELDVGLGMALSGPQVATMLRLRAGGSVAFTLGFGLSVGPYERGPKTTAIWGNSEVGVAVTGQRGTFVRVFVGGGTILMSTFCDTGGEECDRVSAGASLPYLGVTLGKAY